MLHPLLNAIDKYSKNWLTCNEFACTVKLVYNDHPRDPKFVAVVDRWSLFRGSVTL